MSDWTDIPGSEELGEELVLHDLDLVAELTHPTRSSLLHRLRTPRSAAELAADMQVPVTRLYHHLNRLEELGLIVVVATRRSGATTERRYRVATDGFRIDPDAARGRPPAEVATALGALFDVTRTELRHEIETGALDPERLEGRAMLAFLTLSLSDEQRVAFVDRLDALVREFTQFDADTTVADPGANRFRLLLAGFGLTT
jgi:DNA-binding transcriptional ArsR family regulator